jgi:hypothetical protein
MEACPMKYHAPGWTIECYDDGSPVVRGFYDDDDTGDESVTTFQLWAPNYNIPKAVRTSGTLRTHWAFCWGESTDEMAGDFVKGDTLDDVMRKARRSMAGHPLAELALDLLQTTAREAWAA